MKKTILALTLALSLQGLAAASAADNDYIMCPGDQLQVVVYGHEDLSSPPNSNTTPYTVRPDGKVTFPLIGDIDVTGKTVTELLLIHGRSALSPTHTPCQAAGQRQYLKAGNDACLCAGGSKKTGTVRA